MPVTSDKTPDHIADRTPADYEADRQSRATAASRLAKRDDPESAKTDIERFRSIIRGCLVGQASVSEVVKKALSEFASKPSLQKSLAHIAFIRMVRDEVYEQRHTRLARAKQAHAQGNIRGSADGAALSAAIWRSLLDQVIADGRRLRDVYGRELPAMAASEELIGRGHFANAKFYQLLNERTPPDAQVNDKVNDAEAGLLWKQATGAVEPKPEKRSPAHDQEFPAAGIAAA